jgi:hypothetical protein
MWNGPFDSAGSGAFDPAVVDVVDQHADAHHVGGEDELLAFVVALVPDRGEELDRLEPLLAARLHLGHEGMQVLDRRLHHLAQARIRDVLPALQYGFRKVVAGDKGHGSLPNCRASSAFVGRIVSLPMT